MTKLTTTHLDGRTSVRYVEADRLPEVAARLALDPNTALVSASDDSADLAKAIRENDFVAIAMIRPSSFN